ncbi:hypothetical protein B296_00029064 [Ensete ventricosum]|uniref:Uncharacterized protein n=1 Tax=Ensete ventricosum TaxID=4639 RepID=A0A427AM17_ENSVE|nr:hypothetical protein B296_00029064 [Ensete ventricosum]
MDTARTGRYVLVHPLTETRTARYRAIPPIGVVSILLPPEIEEEGEEKGEPGVRHCSPDPFTHVIHRPRAISSPDARRRNVSPCGEKERGNV